MRVETTSIAGLLTVHPDVRTDDRGYFVKTFQRSRFEELGIGSHFDEHFVSFSRRGVIRGMHFQAPPAAQTKLVYCVAGAVLDVVVDLRADSPTFRTFASFDLSDENWTMLHVPIGCAHGFAVTSESASMAYFASTEHSPAADTGIRWDSFGFDWPFDDPIVSSRDRALPPIDSYDSPFTL